MFRRKNILPEDRPYTTPFQLAWRRMKKNRPAVIGLAMIVLSVLLAVLAYLIVPDSTPNANRLLPEIALQPPGYKQEFLLIKKDAERSGFIKCLLYGNEEDYEMIPVAGSIVRESDSVRVNYYRGEGLSSREQKYAVNDLYSKADPVTGKTFLLGTDTYGRDIFSRLIIGIRVSLAVGAMAVFISLLIGVLLGLIAGYYGGKTDDVVMWLVNVIWSIPTLLLVFAITIALGKGFWQIFVAVGLTMWVQVARVVRGQVMTLRNMEYVEAAHSLGYRNLRIMIRHILPNTIGPVMVIAASNFATAILIEAGLSFLGIGVQPPAPSWGSMMRENYGFIISSNPFLALVPGIAIMFMVLAFNLVGNGLRDALDIKTKIN